MAARYRTVTEFKFQKWLPGMGPLRNSNFKNGCPVWDRYGIQISKMAARYGTVTEFKFQKWLPGMGPLRNSNFKNGCPRGQRVTRLLQRAASDTYTIWGDD